MDGVVDRKDLGRVGHRDRVGRTVHRNVDRAIVVVVETAAVVADEGDNHHFREAYSWEVRPFETGVAVALDVHVGVVQEVESVDSEDLLVELEVGRIPVSWDIVVVVVDLALVVMDEGAVEVAVAGAVVAAAAGVGVVGKEEAAGAAILVDPVVREIALAPADSLAFAVVVAAVVHAEVLHGSPETIQELAFADEAFVGPVGPASWVDRVVEFVAAQPRPTPFLRSRVVFPPHDFAAVAALDCVVAALDLEDVPGVVDHCCSIDHL